MSGSDFWKAFSTPFFLMLFFVLAFFSIYKIYEKKPVVPPTIEITSGSDVVTDQQEVPISGKVSNTKIVKINGNDVVVNEDGTFSTNIPVALGQNSIEIVAGDTTQTKSLVYVTREEVKQETTATSINTKNSENLTPSGPAETLMGSIGVAALFTSLVVLRRSKAQNTLQKA